MGMGGGGGKSTTQEQKEVKLPPWVDAQAQSNLALANQIANRPYEANPFLQVVGLDPLAYEARKHVAGLDDYFGDYGAGSAAMKKLFGYNPKDIQASTVGVDKLRDTDLAPYMNPYTQQVEQNALRAVGEQGRASQQALASQATQAKAFGGSRQAVQQGVASSETAKKAGDVSASLREKNFTQAQQAATGDIQREYAAAVQRGEWGQAAQIQSRAHDLAAHQQEIAAAQQLQANADAAQQARMNQIATELGVGDVFQQNKQQKADLRAQQWQTKRDYPLENLNILLATLGMTPYGHTETGTSTTRSKSGGGGAMDMIGGGMSLLKMFMSDERAKTDIEFAGVDPQTKLPMYAYRYKSDPKSYPKVIGVMAQDIEKERPDLVRTLKGSRKGKGRKVVDLTGFVP